MPVTVHPAPDNDYTPYLYGRYGRTLKQEAPQSADAILKSAVNVQVSQCVGEIFQSSFDGVLPSTRNPSLKLEKENDTIYPSSHSFVKTAITAYSNHCHLVVRPDDVWMSILSQFNLYVNAHAEELRHLFVEHKGKKELEVTFEGGSRYTVDFGAFARTMGYVIQENVVDAELREWAIPDFSTTEDNDRVVASVMLMATLKKYFDYKCGILCGFPAVTLLGEKEDWEKMYEKVDKLKSFGKETTDWCHLLKPVLRHFVLTFTDPGSAEVREFWQRIAHYHGGGSGPTYLSGWINAFCFFTDEGKSMYYHYRTGEGPKEEEIGESMMGRDPKAVLKLDGVLYHQIDSEDIPPGYAEVDVKVDDNGQKFDCRMVAGMMAVKLSDSGKKSSPKLKKVIETNLYTRHFSGSGSESGERVVERMVGIEHDGKKDVVQPVVGWFMFEVNKEGQEEVLKDIAGRMEELKNMEELMKETSEHMEEDR